MPSHHRLFVLGSFVAACCAGVERVPRPGESLLATSFSIEPGGKGFNVAVGARRLGVEVDCLAAVGDDLFADLAGPAFEAAGLSAARLVRKAGCVTGSGIGFIGADGENCVAVHPGANHRLSASDVEPHAQAIAEAAMTVSGFEIGDEAIAAAFAIARAAGRPTMLNPSPFRTIAPAVLGATSILVVNRQEAVDLAGSLGRTFVPDDPASVADLAATLRPQGVDVLVITLGIEGAVAATADGIVRQPAFAVPIVDTLGAGDAFLAALAAERVAGASWSEAMRVAAAAGALTATAPGTFAALPTRQAVDLLLASAVPHTSPARS